MNSLKHDSSIWAVLVAALFYALLLGTHLPSNVLSWDVFGYYLYLPATFIYGDLSLSDLSWVKQILELYNGSDTLYQLVPYKDSYLIKYPTGWALLNAPFFLVAHLIAHVTSFPADGFSYPYQMAITWGNYVYVIVGFSALRKLLLNWFQPKVVALVLLAIAFATNLLHQTIQAPGMVHTYLFACYAVFGLLVLRDVKLGKPSFLLGLLVGVLLITRNSELVIIAFLIPLFGWRKEKYTAFFKATYSHWNLFILGAALSILPQLAYWIYVTGMPLVYSYQNPGEGFDWLYPHTVNFLFSFRKGWLLYTPIMLFALIGLWKLKEIDLKFTKSITLLLIVTIYLLSSWTTWWYAASFGQRSMVQSYALLAVPLAAFVQYSWRKWQIATYIGLAFFACWNVFQTYQYEVGIINPSRMTKTAYFAHLFRVEPLDEVDQKKFLIDRSTSAVDDFPTDVKATQLIFQSFESDSGLVPSSWKYKVANIIGLTNGNKSAQLDSSFALTGKMSFKTTEQVPYSPAIRISFEDITDKEHAWIKAKLSAYSQQENVPVSLVVCFEHNGKAYKYRTVDVSLNALNEWQKIELAYLTPEVRRKSDQLLVYLWNRSASSVWVDDISVEIFEDVQ